MTWTREQKSWEHWIRRYALMRRKRKPHIHMSEGCWVVTTRFEGAWWTEALDSYEWP